MTEDVDPEALDPRGTTTLLGTRSGTNVTDDLAETILLGPATDGELGDDWVPSFTPEDRRQVETSRLNAYGLIGNSLGSRAGRVNFGIDSSRQRVLGATIQLSLAPRCGTYLKTKRFDVLPHERDVRRHSDCRGVHICNRGRVDRGQFGAT